MPELGFRELSLLANTASLCCSDLLLAQTLFFCGLTPELSRPAERARRWFNHSASAETAKRARLERIVRPLKRHMTRNV